MAKINEIQTKEKRTANEPKYKIGIYSDLASIFILVFDGVKTIIATKSHWDSYGFIPTPSDCYSPFHK